MKKTIKNSLFALAAFVMLSAFTTVTLTTYNVDIKKSTLVWTGEKVTGKHTGNITLKSGNLVFDGDKLKSGSFVIDMTSITCTDLTDPDYNAKLVGHLKSDDFFGVEKHPEARFDITSVTHQKANDYTVKGNLSIKGQTHPIEFPATITSDGKTIKANAKIEVDRTKYDIKYGSGSFFDNLGDKAIDDIFVLQVELIGKK